MGKYNNKAGTGKFYLIAVLSRILSKLTATVGKLLLLIRATFTSITAFSING